MNRVTLVFLGCVGVLAGVAIAFSCADGDSGLPCNSDECAAGCIGGGYVGGICGPEGCTCTSAADGDGDGDGDGTDVVRDDAAEIPSEVTTDDTAEIPLDVPVDDAADRIDVPDDRRDDGRDDGPDIRDDGGGGYPLCNTTGTCDDIECILCCFTNYGSLGSCSGSTCNCGGGGDGSTG